MTLPFEATRSFCYQFGRYTVLPEIEAMPQVKSGDEFRLVDLVQQVLDRHLTPEQQQMAIKKENSDRLERLRPGSSLFGPSSSREALAGRSSTRRTAA